MPLLNTATKTYVGSVAATAIYLGATKVWPSLPTPPVTNPAVWFDFSNSLFVTLDSGKITRINSQAATPGCYAIQDVASAPAPTTLKGRNAAQFTPGQNLGIVGAQFAPPFTAIAAIKPTVVGTYRAILGASTNGGIEWRLTDAHHQGLVAQQVAAIGADSTTAVTAAAVVAVSYNQVTVKFYLNGALNGSTATSTPISSSDLYMGMAPGDDYDGIIGELFIYNRALTDPEVATLSTYLSGRWV